MKLTKLQLENFRNYTRYSYDFDLSKNFTVLVGPNGKGKTNFLEAIYVLSLGKSFRSSLRDDLIEWEMDYMRCQAEIQVEDESESLEVFYANYPRKQKGLKKNDVSLKSSDYIGNLLTVLFHPEDLNMLYLSPGLRRRYMDILLCQCDRKYLVALSQYNRTLKQRNALLKAVREAQFKGEETSRLKADLQAWDFKLVEFATPVIEKRQALVDYLNKNLPKLYRKISGQKEEVSVQYLNKIQTNYSDELFNRKSRDIIQAKTTAGPHRDDLKFFIDEQEISSSASRGEFRTLLLAIKIAEIEYIKAQTGSLPVLLLDDVFSELDISRQKHLLKAIEGCQTIITTTDASNIEEIAKSTETLTIVKVG